MALLRQLGLEVGVNAPIVSGVINPVQAVNLVQAETGVTDDLVTINNGSMTVSGFQYGYMVLLRADTGDTITIKHNTGNIKLASGLDFTLSGEVQILLYFGGTYWRDLANSLTSGSGMTSFDINADTGTPQTITNSNTVILTGGTGINTVVGATDTITINLDIPVTHEHGGLEANVSAYGGIPIIEAGVTTELKVNRTATLAPTVNEDSADGYSVGSFWYNITTDRGYVCLDATVASAVWIEITSTGSGGIGGTTGATDNSVLRADGVGGATLQNSAVTIDDTGKISNVTDPTSAQDASTKAYVDGLTYITTLALSKGGTNANLSATGGTGHVVKQSGVGSNFTVGALIASEIPSLDTAKITSGTFAEARGGTNQSTYATGDILFASGANTLTKRAIGTAGQVLTVTGGVPVWAAAGGGGSVSYALYRDEKANNTNGGTFTSGAWQTRELNTESFDPDGIGTLASNQITLSAGTYIITARAPAVNVNRHQCRLQNITAGTTIAFGASAFVGTAGGGDSVVTARVVLAVTTAIELQNRCQSTVATSGFGAAVSFGNIEVYSEVYIQKIG